MIAYRMALRSALAFLSSVRVESCLSTFHVTLHDRRIRGRFRGQLRRKWGWGGRRGAGVWSDGTDASNAAPAAGTGRCKLHCVDGGGRPAGGAAGLPAGRCGRGRLLQRGPQRAARDPGPRAPRPPHPCALRRARRDGSVLCQQPPSPGALPVSLLLSGCPRRRRPFLLGSPAKTPTQATLPTGASSSSSSFAAAGDEWVAQFQDRLAYHCGFFVAEHLALRATEHPEGLLPLAGLEGTWGAIQRDLCRQLEAGAATLTDPLNFVQVRGWVGGWLRYACSLGHPPLPLTRARVTQ